MPPWRPLAREALAREARAQRETRVSDDSAVSRVAGDIDKSERCGDKSGMCDESVRRDRAHAPHVGAGAGASAGASVGAGVHVRRARRVRAVGRPAEPQHGERPNARTA